MFTWRALAVGAAVATLAAACGGSGRATGPTTSAGSSTATTGTTPAGVSAGGGSTTASSPRATTAPRAGLTWHACDGSDGPARYQCATLKAPLDPTRPSGPTINLALDRRPASGSRIGSLLVNPGGPGVSAVDDLPGIANQLGSAVRDRFDVVAFDPPGVGHSTEVTCLNSAGLAAYFHVDPAPITASGFSALVAADRTFAEGCEARSRAVLPYVSTVDAARAMDEVRQALGDAKLTYLGFSYGTLLGATYADLYPDRVRALVLDGALDPALDPLTLVRQQTAALDAQLQQFFTACRNDPTCAWQPGSNPAATYQILLRRVRNQPLPVTGTARTVGPAELLYGTVAALYSTQTWSNLASALEQADSGNGTQMLSLFDSYTGRSADGTYNNLFEANAAVTCLDTPSPSLAQLQADAPAIEAAAPVFGLQDLYSFAGCSVWPVPPTGTAHAIHAVGAPPILVVGSTGDPITPYAWAQSLARQLARGVLLTRAGEGHTAYGASSCIRSKADVYLIDLKVPAPGTRCASD